MGGARRGRSECGDLFLLEELAGPWHPHATTACLYLWRSLDATPD